ncbi:MAG: 4'-phosphopantetheinyl transferase superfamily protein [Gemmatimonadaceae bacterium]|nr:4'-phosphopantetheinyl transferase superfamily protein [Gemmatimonadaceae bacterium]
MSITQRVTVWLAWRVAPSAPLVATLSPDEHARAHRYRDPADADAFRWARGVQRVILGAHLGAAPEALRFVQQGDSKPALAGKGGGQCEYNASHSGDLLAIAVSDKPVGVDIEQHRPMPAFAKVTRRVFAAEAAERILAEPDAHRAEAFFAEWTALEAHAKLHGHGVWRILAERERHGAAERVQTAPLATPAGYSGGVAVAGAEPAVSVRWWGSEILP